MAQIASVDWDAKRFYLHADTVTNGFDAWEAFTEVRVLQQAHAANEQNYPLFIHRQGKVAKGGGRFTPRYVSFNSGWRAVPHDQVAHKLDLLVEMVSDDQVSDRDMFDRSAVPVNVDIDAVYDQVEIIERDVGSGLDATQDANLTFLRAAADGDQRREANRLRVWPKGADKEVDAPLIDKDVSGGGIEAPPIDLDEHTP